MGGYPVSLSSIGAVPQNCEAFFRSPVGTLQKTRFFSKFFGSKRNYFLIKVVNFLTGAPFTIKPAATLEV